MSFFLPSGVINDKSAYFYAASAAGTLGTLMKQPSEQVLMLVDYSHIVPVGTVTSYAFSIDVSSNPALIVSFPVLSTAGVLSFLLSGGIPGQQYSLIITATLTGGVTRQDGIFIDMPSYAGACEPPFNDVPDIYTSLPSGTNSYVNTGIRFFWGEAPPANPNVGDQWYRPSDKQFFEWITDGVTLFWMATGNVGLVSEAPKDGGIYGRSNGGWVALPGTPPPPGGNEYNVTTNQKVTLPGTYYIRNVNLTVALPTTPPGGDIILVDMTGAWPNLTLTGNSVNTTHFIDVLPQNGKLTIRWSTLNAGVLVI